MELGLNRILSESSLDLHKEYLRRQKLKYSILEKSFPEISGKKICQISKMKIKDKSEIESLYLDIMFHNVYFSSFGKEYQGSDAVKKRFRTEASFLYELFEAGKKEDGGFILIYFNKGLIDYTVVSKCSNLRIEPILSVDLCEHAYFLDYGFEKEEYLNKALSLLNLNSLDKIF